MNKIAFSILAVLLFATTAFAADRITATVNLPNGLQAKLTGWRSATGDIFPQGTNRYLGLLKKEGDKTEALEWNLELTGDEFYEAQSAEQSSIAYSVMSGEDLAKIGGLKAYAEFMSEMIGKKVTITSADPEKDDFVITKLNLKNRENPIEYAQSGKMSIGPEERLPVFQPEEPKAPKADQK